MALPTIARPTMAHLEDKESCTRSIGRRVRARRRVGRAAHPSDSLPPAPRSGCTRLNHGSSPCMKASSLYRLNGGRASSGCGCGGCGCGASAWRRATSTIVPPQRAARAGRNLRAAPCRHPSRAGPVTLTPAGRSELLEGCAGLLRCTQTLQAEFARLCCTRGS
jgi:hypothetical protein